MDFYPPLNIELIFDKTRNDREISKFGFESNYNNNYNYNYNFNTNLSKSKSDHYYYRKNSSNQAELNYLSLKSQSLFFKPNKLLRKLGHNEKIFHGFTEKTRSYIYRTVIVTSEIDFYKNIDLVYKSIDEWKSIHPLLRCRILTKQDDSKINSEKYFAYADESKIRANDNIFFYYYNSNPSKQCEDIWKLMVERETTLPLDGEDSLLWRLTFLQIKNYPKNEQSNKNIHLYSIILTYDHSIMDGRSSYNSLLQLFSILENKYLNNYQKLQETKLLPPKEDIFKYKLKELEQNYYKQTINYSYAPQFLDIENSYLTSYIKLKNLTHEEEANGFIYSHDNKAVLTVDELINISKQNNSKFRTLVIQKPDFNVILKKCKQNQVKLTTFINMCLVKAVRMIYQKYEGDFYYFNKEPTINFATNVSLREFPEYFAFDIEKKALGCYIGLSLTSFKESLSKNFWQVARNESEEFHDKLDKGYFIPMAYLPNRPKGKKEFFYHFGNSNLGVVNSSLTETKLIRVKQTFSTSRYSKENFLCWFSNLISTIDNQLCWTISYNTNFIKQEIINLLIENLTKVIKELIK